jgi:NAD(P)-dependent dehydrogenase (short-subunit alcohol dehydrogenase family)
VQGRTIVVTGASSGIGAAAAVELSRLGATVVSTGRDPDRLAAVAQEVREVATGETADPLRADFASLDEVRQLAADLLDRHERIDVLVNNAGLIMGQRTLSADGYEMTFAVNHLAPFLLTSLLRDRLRQSAPARVITTSSDAHRGGTIDLDDLQLDRSWSRWRAYNNSKLANILFTRELAGRLDGEGVVANTLHPGVIRTRFGRGDAGALFSAGYRVASPFFASAKTGASTIVYLAASPEAADVSGGYYVDSKPRSPSAQAQDDALAGALWERSEELARLRPGLHSPPKCG